MVALAFASWIAARSVHRGSPSELVPPVSHTPSPGVASLLSAVELTTTGKAGVRATSWPMLTLDEPVAVRFPVEPAPPRISSATSTAAVADGWSARSVIPAGGVVAAPATLPKNPTSVVPAAVVVIDGAP